LVFFNEQLLHEIVKRNLPAFALMRLKPIERLCNGPIVWLGEGGCGRLHHGQLQATLLVFLATAARTWIVSRQLHVSAYLLLYVSSLK
jgi:hypothetical protein